MMTLVSVLSLGFFLGMRHATDADHVLAVATIVSRERRVGAATMIGLLWGVGHTLAILLAGGAVILFGAALPPRVGLSMELSGGLVLVLLGAFTVRGVLRGPTAVADPDAGHRHEPGGPPATHSHAHAHGDYVHTHPHSHGAEGHAHGETETPLGRLDARLGGLGPYRLLRPLVVGAVHGLAGSAAVTLLVLGTIRDPAWALAYLLCFGLGTVGGMMVITAAVGIPFAYSARRFALLNRTMALVAGLLSVGFGAFLSYQAGLVDGLFHR
jgi:high-affinity nickel-transport protein